VVKKVGGRMNKPFLAFLACISLVAPAGAADLAVKAPAYKSPPPVVGYDWTGFYVGGHVGYGWGQDGGTTFTDSPPGTFAFAFGTGELLPFVGTSPKGVLGGGQAGYNWQVAPNWLIGVEGDISGSGIKGSGLFVFPGGGGVAPANQTASQSLDWLATVRGRAGFVVDRLLIYGTGGAAFGEVRNNFNISAPTIAASIIGNASSTRAGWVAGAGAEYAFWSNWSVKLEWLHYDLGSTSVFAPQFTAGVVQPFGLNGRVVTKGDIVWAGLNYRFGGPVVAR
jgi:outer membrane immunogenic protein